MPHDLARSPSATVPGRAARGAMLRALIACASLVSIAAAVSIATIATVAAVQSSRPVGQFIAENAPRPPVFPLGIGDCQAYAEALSRFDRDVGARHQACLDANRDCPDDSATGCSCQACAQFHGSAPRSGVDACYQAVRSSEERLERVNQVLTSVGVSSGELLVRGTIGQQIRNAIGDSQLAKDLGRVSAIAHSVDSIRQRLLALRESVSRGDVAAPPRQVSDILQELGRRGLSRSPVALLMTDIALEQVGRMQSDALAALDQQLAAINRDLAASSGSPPASSARECAVLADERANRELMQRDAASWVALVARCNPK
jgi:hypothetical protein